jgi:transposase-like protein
MVSKRVGVGRSSLWRWGAQAEIEGGEAPGVTIEENEEIRRLRAEIRPLPPSATTPCQSPPRAAHPGGLAVRVE